MIPRFFRIFTLLALLLPTITVAGESSVAHSEHGMVVSPERHASEIGAQILAEGGNAVDATIAVAFTLAVTNPQAGGLGGGGFALVRDANGDPFALDFREVAPAALRAEMFLKDDGRPDPRLSLASGLGVGVPGLPRGLEALHARWGSLPWSRLIAPAVALAQDGFDSYPHLHSATTGSKPRLQLDRRARRIFLEDGEVPPTGTRLRQRKLAKLLRRIQRHGADAFYQGTTAKSITRTVRQRGGVMTTQDLADYGVRWRTPLIVPFRGYRVLAFPPPSSGGVALAQLLRMWEQQADAPELDSIAGLHRWIEFERRAFADRSQWLGDPDFVDTPVQRMLEWNYIDERIRSFNPQRATPSSEIGAGEMTPESVNTLHFSVADANGMAIALTTTLNTNFGSGIVAKGTGVVLNNELDDFALAPGIPNVYGLVGGEANALEPGKRPLSSMSPTIVDRGAASSCPDLVLGSPGGGRIITAVAWVTMRTLIAGELIQQAVDAPRLHHQWLPDRVDYEPEMFDAATSETLRGMGHTLQESPKIGNVNAIQCVDGRWTGVADRRRGGTASAP